MAKVVRVDKWLWAMRLYKTRSIAADACRANRVKVNDGLAKPARPVEVGDVVSARRGHITYTYKVLQLIGNRQPASNLPKYIKDITPQSELDKLNVPRETIFVQRDRGSGRPTKRERRQIDSLMDELIEVDYGQDVDFDFDD